MNDKTLLYDTYAQVGCYSFIPLELRPWGPYDKITSESRYIEKWTTESFLEDLFCDENYFKKKYTGNLQGL